MVAIGDRKEIKMSVIKVNAENFEQLKNQNKPVLLDFYADWCGPCRMISPLVDELAEERDDIVVGKVNVDENPELTREFGISNIPALIVLKNGNVTGKSSGYRPKEKIAELIDA